MQFDVAVKAYVGMDIPPKTIQYLNDNVSRPEFKYFAVPFANAMYNPTGVPLTADATLPGGDEPYDLIVMQSVFTHFNPQDFVALLHVLRRHSASDARLFFTCFIDNDMESDFLDSVPDKPLLMAYYKESFIRRMLGCAGWTPLALYAPSNQMQHQFACTPLPDIEHAVQYFGPCDFGQWESGRRERYV